MVSGTLATTERRAGGNGLDGPATAAIDGGAIAALARDGEDVAARDRLDANGLLVVPGLVDIHTHV